MGETVEAWWRPGFMVSAGYSATVPAPMDLEKGQGVWVGALFGVSAGTYTAGETATIVTGGTVLLPRPVGETWDAVGQLVYWDEANQVATIDPAASGGRTGIGHNTWTASGDGVAAPVRLEQSTV
jgi:predicted RecA/RadA family phage recombinase